MKKLIVEAPLNPLSLGQVSVNFLRELAKRKDEYQVSIFPIGNIDISAYNLSEETKKWMEDGINNRLKKLNRSTPSLKVWHLSGSDNLRTPDQYLYSFYEADSPTTEEINIVKHQKHVFFSNQYNIDTFEMFGNLKKEAMSVVPLGLDEDFKVDDSVPKNDAINFLLAGKWEKRKNTHAIINAWVKKYGNNPKYMLHLLVYNPHFKQEDNQHLILQALEGKNYSNINYLSPLKTNAEVCRLINFIDIDLSGISSAEGWGLPAFNATALGKWSIVVDATGHKEWATEKNSILIEPNGKQPIYDGIFFNQGQPFNQGNSFSFDGDELVEAFEKAEKLAKTVNTEGLKLAEQFTYKKSVDKILEKIYG